MGLTRRCVPPSRHAHRVLVLSRCSPGGGGGGWGWMCSTGAGRELSAGVVLRDGRLPRLVCAGGVFAPRCTSAATSAAGLRSDDEQTLTMADDWQSAFTEAEYDAIILGTGMKECILSGSRNNEKMMPKPHKLWNQFGILYRRRSLG